MEQDPTPVSPSAYQLPVTPPRSNKKRIFIIVGVVVALLIIIGAAVAAFFYYPPFAAFKSALSLPQELKGATFLADGPDGTTAYTLQGISYKATSLAGTLVSADKEPDVQIVRSADGMYQVRVGGKQLFATTTPLAGITASKDQSTVVMAISKQPGAALFDEGGQLSVLAIDATEWHLLYQQKTADGALRIDGPTGVAPLLLADGTVIYLSPAGVSSWNPRTGVVTILVARTLRASPISVLQSEDGTKIAFRDPLSKELTVYAVTATNAEPVHTITLTDVGLSYALGNDGLYAIKRSVVGSEIWKQGFAEEEMHRIGFLPTSLSITRLLTSSL